MKLYGSLTSPYVRKTRILLKEKSIPCEFITVDPWAADSSMSTLNPLGKVPVLVQDNEEVLFDSLVVLEYLDLLKTPSFLPASGAARFATLRWQALAQGMLDATVTRVLEMRRPTVQQSVETVARQENKILHAIEYADRAYSGKTYLLQDYFTLADLSLGVALEYIDFRYPHPWRERQPRLAQWLSGIVSRPAFIETLPPGMERATTQTSNSNK